MNKKKVMKKIYLFLIRTGWIVIISTIVTLIITTPTNASVINQSFTQSVSGDSSASISHGFSNIPDVIYIQATNTVDSSNSGWATGSVVGNNFASSSWSIKQGGSGDFSSQTFTLCSNVNAHCYNFDMSADNTNLEMRWTQAGSCCGGLTGYFTITSEYTEPAVAGSSSGGSTIVEGTDLTGLYLISGIWTFVGVFFGFIFYNRTKVKSF